MNILKPEYTTNDDGSEVVSCYKLTIGNPLQFYLVFSLLIAGFTYLQILRAVLEKRDWLG